MRILISVTLTITLSLLLVGCGPSHQEVLESSMNSWIGHHRDELFRAWGPPAQEIRLSNGGSIMTFRSGGGQAYVPTGGMVFSVPISCQQDMETDASGKIVRWRYQGNC